MAKPRLMSISDREQQLIDDRIAHLRQWYSSYLQVPPCLFSGDPCDLSTLTFISYELEDLWDWDAGETVSCVWGQVLVKRFGFQWAKVGEGFSPFQLVVHNVSLPYIVFPWSRLFELISNGGSQHTTAEDFLVMTLADLHSREMVPEGWHPVIDALQRSRYDIPEEIVAQVQKLVKRDKNWLKNLGLFPYQWNKDVPWEVVSLYLTSLIENHGTHHRA